MECSLASTYSNSSAKPSSAVSGNRSPAKSGLHVNFTEKVEVKEKREKFLTAKYGAHQMSLIRKRLAVEMWLLEELQKLYDLPKVSYNLNIVPKIHFQLSLLILSVGKKQWLTIFFSCMCMSSA